MVRLGSRKEKMVGSGQRQRGSEQERDVSLRGCNRIIEKLERRFVNGAHNDNSHQEVNETLIKFRGEHTMKLNILFKRNIEI